MRRNDYSVKRGDHWPRTPKGREFVCWSLLSPECLFSREWSLTSSVAVCPGIVVPGSLQTHRPAASRAWAPPPPCSVAPPLGASSLWTRTVESRPASWGGCGAALPGGLRCPSNTTVAETERWEDRRTRPAPGMPLHIAHGDSHAGARLLLPPR